jgi:hypothetical protein
VTQNFHIVFAADGNYRNLSAFVFDEATAGEILQPVLDCGDLRWAEPNQRGSEGGEIAAKERCSWIVFAREDLI